jgi:hypothetical protein
LIRRRFLFLAPAGGRTESGAARQGTRGARPRLVNNLG